MSLFKRILGLIITVVSIIGMLTGIFGAFYVPRIFTQLQGQSTTIVQGIFAGFDPAETTVRTLQNTLVETNQGLDAVATTTLDLATVITSTKPILDETVVLLGTNVPDSVETMQTSLPNLIAVAQTVDTALLTLSNLSVNDAIGGNVVEVPDVEILGQSVPVPDITLPVIPINIDLGIDYDQSAALDDSLAGFGEDLDGVPESMRELSASLDVTSQNLFVLGEDVALISDNIDDINAEISMLPPQIDDYLDSLNSLKTNILLLDNTVGEQLSVISTVLVVLLIWLALFQLAPLYVGINLLFGRSFTRELTQSS